MRLICFCIPIFLAVPARLPGQDAVAAALRSELWGEQNSNAERVRWSLFTRQNHGVSNWNVAGLSVSYARGSGSSGLVVYRDGIPGISWYHLLLSHYHAFGDAGCMLQLRLSAISLKGRPPMFRIGGNAQINWSLQDNLRIRLLVYDFPGWLFSLPQVRGDPAIELFIFHEPGRLIGLTGGFRISPGQFGPVSSGVSINLNDRVRLTGMVNALPFGVSIGVRFSLGGFRVHALMEEHSGMGATPTIYVTRNP